MRATVYQGTGDVRVENVPDPVIKQPTDAVVRITHACICGSDLWFYRGLDNWKPGWRTGHEWMGIVEEVGSEVRNIKKGDRVLAPFAFSDGSCEFCGKSLQTSCVRGGFWGGESNDGGQAEAIRAQFADGTLVTIPKEVENDDAILTKILPLTDVMSTGHHAAISAGVRQGGTAAVIGDGAVGLCGVLAAKRLGAERIIIIGRHEDRLDIARRFGATDVVKSKDQQAVDEVLEITKGGAESVLECVGTESSMDNAISITRPGGAIGYVGVPHGSETINLSHMFFSNITLRGGVAPARAYIPELLDDVIAGKIDPSPVLDLTVDLNGVPSGYAAMDKREAIKVMVRP
ncbi:zinc-dependent alcohol dehydrogenase family protein [Aetokthonos hydrillicola Thurmond2011]|uniref:Zinc-dependent alcohol dehydrogenase family protein n=1 Tax=Aetokthonos hydrillicola Thurmond2011 TaxID=2712845 RepID=A0AAP5M8M2_9CYAN|nr:zinc-dependent alcohol dehydrogenase family protein [Aetokthonos hydrillicola]MBO3457453.1 zinc-dependent alcohol dehydrogenase family protein [Aetokthonos hydrillicola CCALA 1050]MBW4586026.1 zinc-dependent alcohol dehydrogenase family protein [Aetokthonos hydrillicola CCALA 1050]MDR9893748.1 zinc-dependent alcohol dehydrogenase family protein [Aetokthonos hydrillicola Thurmond2011]